MDDPATVASIYLRGFFLVDVFGQLPWRVLLARFHHCRLDFTHGSFNYGSFNSKTLHGESLDPLSSHRLSPRSSPRSSRQYIDCIAFADGLLPLRALRLLRLQYMHVSICWQLNHV